MHIGAALGPYKIVRHLGTGGMGAVWLAEDTRLHRQVALKMVRPADAGGAAARERLMREARAAASLNHPHIATVHDVLDHDDQVVIVLEYVDGETL
ncbi:MAG TPA: protein kinase, partial [Vicinamibacterales bacterium]